MERRTFVSYSIAFRQKIVKEIEDGKLSISEARKLYNIKGGSTIQQWIKKMRKDHLMNKVIKVELTGEVNMLKQREKEKLILESALAQAHLRILSLEKMLEIASRDYGEDIKKKYVNEV